MRILPPPSVGRRETAVFTRQLAILIKAGIPVVRALDVLARQAGASPMRPVISGVADVIRGGGSLSDGLKTRPRVFEPLYVNLVAAGEASGALGTILERLALFQEKSRRLSNKVKSAMAYPAIVMTVSIAIVSGLLVFVVPRFQDIFESQLKGQPLPSLTQAVISSGTLIKGHLAAAAGSLCLICLLVSRIRRTPRGRRLLDRIVLRLPLLGDLAKKTVAARFARTFGTLLAGGVPMLQALGIAGDTIGNSHVSAAIGTVRNRVREGDTVAAPLAATRLFPAMVSGMIEVGEETGSLPEMLTRVADACEEEVDLAVSALVTLIEPAMIVLMAILVGTIVIALFLPIIRIVQLMS